MLSRFLHQKHNLCVIGLFSVLFLTPLIRTLCLNRRGGLVDCDWLTVVYV